jgi:hypothetical protein
MRSRHYSSAPFFRIAIIALLGVGGGSAASHFFEDGLVSIAAAGIVVVLAIPRLQSLGVRCQG